MSDKYKILTITTDKRDAKQMQSTHDRFVPDTYTLFKAKNAKEAVKMMDEITPDAIVIKLLNSKLDGLDLIAKAKEHAPRAKLFVYSYDDDQETIDAYKAAGAYKYYIIPLLIDIYFHDLYVALHAE